MQTGEQHNCFLVVFDMLNSLFDLYVSQLAAKLGVVVFSPVLWVKPSQPRKDLIADDDVSSHAREDKRPILFGEFASSQLRHEHVQSANATYIGQQGEKNAVHTSLGVRNSELLSIVEELGVGFDVVGALEADMEAQLGLPLR